MANIITGAYTAILVGLGFLLREHLDAWRSTSLAMVIAPALFASTIGGFFGAMFGALFAPQEAPGDKKTRRTLVKSAVTGNLVAIPVAGHVGAIFAMALDFVYGPEAPHQNGVLELLLALGSGAGIMAGTLSGVWWRYRQKPAPSQWPAGGEPDVQP
jgi:hypothetical protein